MPRITLRSVGVWLCVICYWLTLFVATHVPVEMAPLPPGISDKSPHFFAYALLAIFLAAAWHVTTGQVTWRQLCAIWMLLVLYGAFDELTQIPVGRHASILDLLADAAGATAGLAIFYLWNRWRTSHD
jgi:VanZ family protein